MLRVVVREDLTYEMASDLVKDIVATVDWLDHHFTYSRAPCSVTCFLCFVAFTACLPCSGGCSSEQACTAA